MDFYNYLEHIFDGLFKSGYYIDETLGVVGATLEGMDCHIL